MSIQRQIFKWVQGLDAWKQELFLRAAAAPELSDDDVRAVTSMLLDEKIEGDGPRVVTADDFPGVRRGEEPMAIHSISDLRNVNAIADGESLAFDPTGLNLIFGKNGAGKTGYTRILKHAGRSLYRETVLTNLEDGDDSGPSATLTISVGDDVDAIGLDLEQPAPAHLGRICIADERSCETYLTTETEVDYAPVMLTNLRRFRDGLQRVDEELDRRREEAEPAELDLSPFAIGTKVRTLLAGLPVATPQAVKELAALSEEELAKRESLRRKRGEIEAAQAPKLREAAEGDARAAQKLGVDLTNIAAAFGEEKVWEAKQRLAAIEELRRAADLAAANFEKEPLPGVGSDPWRVLWKAAEEFAAHVREQLPPDHDAGRCIYCMQELRPDARERLARFEEFVSSSVNAQLKAAVQADKDVRGELPDPAALRARHEDAIGRLGMEDGELGHDVVAWLEAADRVRKSLQAGELDELAGVRPPPDGVEQWAAEREKEAAEHAALEKVDDQAELRRELAELDAQHALKENREAVLAHLGAEVEARRIFDKKKELGKTQVSNKMTQLSREMVEADLQGALNRQLKALGFRALEVEAKAKTPKGTPKVALRLKTVDDVPLTSVLSKGEQRRLSLAMFLAEMEVVSDPSPIVLDDPVTSIDQEGRRNIAKTLVALAEKRQVIVFTHELSFVREIQTAAEQGSLRVQQVRRIDKTVGHVSDELPWEGMKAKHRTQWLKKKIAAAGEIYEARDDERYRQAASEVCMLLRQSFERAVEEEVFGDVITRRSDTIHTTGLHKVIVTEEICELVDRGTAENSPWVHDQPLADGSDPPNPEELENGLDVYEQLLAAAKSARKSVKESDGGAPKLVAVEPLNPSPAPDEGATLSGP